MPVESAATPITISGESEGTSFSSTPIPIIHAEAALSMGTRKNLKMRFSKDGFFSSSALSWRGAQR